MFFSGELKLKVVRKLLSKSCHETFVQHLANGQFCKEPASLDFVEENMERLVVKRVYLFRHSFSKQAAKTLEKNSRNESNRLVLYLFLMLKVLLMLLHCLIVKAGFSSSLVL